jgi:hypothetical protein
MATLAQRAIKPHSPERLENTMTIRFGYWMPLGSGGMVVSSIPQRTDWSLDYNVGLAQAANPPRHGAL